MINRIELFKLDGHEEYIHAIFMVILEKSYNS